MNDVRPLLPATPTCPSLIPSLGRIVVSFSGPSITASLSFYLPPPLPSPSLPPPLPLSLPLSLLPPFLSPSLLPPSPPLCLSLRKLTLENLYWTIFDNEEERANTGKQFVQLVQEQLAKPAAEVGLIGWPVHNSTVCGILYHCTDHAWY